MKLYRYWAAATADGEATEGPFLCYAGSDDSREEAVRRAVERSKKLTRIFTEEEFEELPGRYPYGERAMREEIIQPFEDDGRLVAAVTRNGYGSLVLNTAGVLFADIDYPPPRAAGLGGLIGKLFGRKSPEPPASPDEQIIGRVERIAHQSPGLGLRLYRTAAGFRVLATSRTYEPNSPESRAFLESLGSDPMYVRLCGAQECFRARLTPKFWRCGAERPPSRFPWRSEEEEQDYRRWEGEYHKAASGYAACELVGQFGPREIAPAVARVLEVHDHLAVGEGKPLA